MTQEIWFTSDTHFGHKNILKYCNRPFANVEEMDEALIRNWNERVKPGDTVYHLGDFGFHEASRLRRIIARLIGEIHIRWGNHDKPARQCADMFASVGDYAEINIGKQKVVLAHYGMRVWNRSHHGSIMLYGHSHGNLPGNDQSLDVGTDCWDYHPVNLAMIQARLKTLPPYTGYGYPDNRGDHHGRTADL